MWLLSGKRGRAPELPRQSQVRRSVRHLPRRRLHRTGCVGRPRAARRGDIDERGSVQVLRAGRSLVLSRVSANTGGASCGGHRPGGDGRRRVPDRGRRRHRGRRAHRRSLPDRGQRHDRDCGRDRRGYADRYRRLAQPLHRGRTGVDLSGRADRPGGLRLRGRQERPRESSSAWPRPDRGRCRDRRQHHHRPRSRPPIP